MANIKLTNASVDIPVFNSSSRSITNSIVKAATGGRLSADKSGHIQVKALDSINLELHSGDRLGIVGHNGAGKSTLLRLLSGIYEPTSGSIERTGSISSLVDINLGINPENTGRENIFLRAKLMGLGNKEILQKLDEIIEFSDLGDFISLPVRTYSSGMLLRLAFAVATSISAEVLIMDEWLSVGDGAFASRAEERLKSLVESSEVLVLASHSKKLIESTANKVLWLEHGQVRQFGETADVCSAYFG
jgi:lipopolysaccharide transport system ATP-binding protein